MTAAPPNDQRTEQALLGACLLTNELIDTVTHLAPDDLYHPQHTNVWEAMVALRAAGQPVDHHTLVDQLRSAGHHRGRDTDLLLTDIVGAAGSRANVARYATTIVDLATRRASLDLGRELAQRAQETAGDTQALVEWAGDRIVAMANRNRPERGPVTIGDALEEWLKREEEFEASGADRTTLGISTGNIDLDGRLLGFRPGQLVIVAARPALGKAQPVETPVAVPGGWRPIGDLQPGDQVIGRNGAPTRVLAVHRRGRLPIYNVRLSDGLSTRACGDHLWHVQSHHDRTEKRSGSVVSTKEIAAGLARGRTRNFHLPMAGPVQHPARVLPLDPYLLGLLLGDGGITRSTPRLTTADPELAEAARQACPPNTTVRRVRGSYAYSIREVFDGCSIAECRQPHASRGWCNKHYLKWLRYGDPSVEDGRRGVGAARAAGVALKARAGVVRPPRRNAVTSALVEMGLHGHRSEKKWIPAQYLTGSVDQRLALLQGLLDTDGWYGCHAVQFASASRALTDGVMELARSLGGMATGPRFKPNAQLGSWHTCLRLPEGMTPFRLGRKLTAWQADEPTRKMRPDHKVVSVKPAGEAECVCITVDAPDGLYVTEHHIVTHNSAFGLQLGVTAASAGHPVLFCSLEMGVHEITERILGSSSRTDLTRIRTHSLIDADWPRVTDTVSHLTTVPLAILDDATVTVPGIRAWAKRAPGLGMIIVDYLQLVPHAGRAANREAEVAEVARGCKRMAQELQVPVIALAQINRGVEQRADKRPTMADLRESGEIEAAADVVLGLYRDDYYDPESADRGIAEVLILKQRNGPTGTVKLAWLDHYGRFDLLRSH